MYSAPLEQNIALESFPMYKQKLRMQAMYMNREIYIVYIYYTVQWFEILLWKLDLSNFSTCDPTL